MSVFVVVWPRGPHGKGRKKIPVHQNRYADRSEGTKRRTQKKGSEPVETAPTQAHKFAPFVLKRVVVVDAPIVRCKQTRAPQLSSADIGTIQSQQAGVKSSGKRTRQRHDTAPTVRWVRCPSIFGAVSNSLFVRICVLSGLKRIPERFLVDDAWLDGRRRNCGDA